MAAPCLVDLQSSARAANGPAGGAASSPRVTHSRCALPLLPPCFHSQLYLFHAAALPGTGLLGSRQAPGSAQLSDLKAARVPRDELPQRLMETLHVSADDAVAASRVRPALQQLIGACVMLVAHCAGIGLAGGGVYTGWADGPDAWLDNFVGLAATEEEGGAVRQAAVAARDSGLLSHAQLYHALMHLREKLRKL